MRIRLQRFFMLSAMVSALLTVIPLRAQTAVAAPQQFVYVLRVAPRLHDGQAWTARDHASVGAHFKRLQRATEERKVILAGRTSESLDKTFGIVIFEADNEAQARSFMESDPAVLDGVMTAELHPYSVALVRK